MNKEKIIKHISEWINENLDDNNELVIEGTITKEDSITKLDKRKFNFVIKCKEV